MERVPEVTTRFARRPLAHAPAKVAQIAFGKEEDVPRESLVEHGVMEFCLFRSDRARGKADFSKHVTVLREVVKHHVEEEEAKLLPKADKAMREEALQALGSRMERRFARALESDFREPLVDSLRQVLEGRTKTKPPKAIRARGKVRRAGLKRSRPSTRSSKRAST